MIKQGKQVMDKLKSKPKGFTSIFIPIATVFTSSFCIMVLELVASRLIARYLGSSLYTWTAVIGVILAGITIGNYLGGRIADRFPARRSIAVLFAVCSMACVVTIILNNIVGDWTWLWRFNWPLRVFTHVSLVFMLPSVLLGTISPVVAKMALEQGLPTGRTIGDIYAWGAAGSIAGTFAAGYWLIAAMGTIAIIWTIGAVLLLMSILYWARLRLLYAWAIIFIAMMTMAMIPSGWAKSAALSVNLRPQPDPSLIYEDESRYSHIVIRRAPDNPNRRFFYEDKLMHSEIMMEDLSDLKSFYIKTYAAVTEGLSKNKEKLCVLVIGGGGYVYPRYVEELWPGSRIDVVEIDPAVTRAAMEAFGLPKDTAINTIYMDARNYIDKLLEQKHNGKEIPRYDFICEDAFNDYSVPFQLVTKEFNDKISAILSNDGVYMVNLIDIFDSGLFVGSVINTLKETFPYVYVATRDNLYSFRNTFVITASKVRLNLKNIISQSKQGQDLELWYPDDSDISKLEQKSRQFVLTDDYCPVENLLAPVVCDNTKDAATENFLRRAKELQQKGQFAESIENYLSAMKAYPSVSIQSYNEIGIMYVRMGNLEQAAEAFGKAIQYNDESEYKVNMASVYYRLGVVLKKLGKSEQATGQFHKAAEEIQRELAEKPASHETWGHLGDTLAQIEDLNAAAEAFKKAIALNPENPAYYYDSLIRVFEHQGLYGEAIEVLKKQIQLMEDQGRQETVSQLQEHLKSLEYKNAEK
jgi:spermidine synthase/Flp pilus assembly protein TadD